MSDPTERLMPDVPPAARWLGLAGLIPFVGGAILAWVLPQPWAAKAYGAVMLYAAVILSFMGGCRWGFAAAGLGTGPGYLSLGLSTLPALLVWLVFSMPLPFPEVWLMFGFAVLLASDVLVTRTGGAPAWWPALRWPLSLGAIASLGAVAVL